ncbi:aspartate aminotransferase family protein [Castellaniella sp.]|uniref:aspartate aminotransferase family protein n=1 Tax=Castellaniella sp. TaxID=1955812 RepID=UPI00355D88A2
MQQIEETAIYREYIRLNSESGRHARRAQQSIPAGASRTLLRFPPYPFFVRQSVGKHTFDIDGNRRIDFNNNYTSQILGHADPRIVKVVGTQMQSGSVHSSPGELEIEFAELLAARIPSVDQVVFLNSGTEAVMMALRIARAYTGRNRIAKVEGGYHGWYDPVAQGTSLIPELGDPRQVSRPQAEFAGLPQAAADDVTVFKYNDVEAVKELFATHGQDLAAVIVEPLLCSSGMIPADRAFLAAIQTEARKHGVLIICDEVVTLRLAEGGFQSVLSFEPDLTTMGKIIGGGFPVGAVGGRLEIMQTLTARPARGGAVAGMGTFSANPVSIAAGLETMRQLSGKAISDLNALGNFAMNALREQIRVHGAPAQVAGYGSLFQIHWTTLSLVDSRGANTADENLRLLCFLGLLNRGVQLSMRCGAALSLPMARTDIQVLADAFSDVLAELKKEGLFAPRVR